MSEEAEETYSLLPVEECAIHPLARIRFDYEVEELAESMAVIGQVQPGKAVVEQNQNGETRARYLVYIGCRRLLACRKASVRHFKALVTRNIEESRIQRELLTENMKRANLSVLEELNLLANYSKGNYSLDDLARDMGFSPRLVRGRVKLAILLQEKSLIETLYKVERVSGFKFTHKHIEKIAALEEGKWLPLAIQAAELNWKTEDIETLGSQFTRESLIETLPAWGHQFIATDNGHVGGTDSSTTHGIATSKKVSDTGHSFSPTAASASRREESEQREYTKVESHSRYQTLARSVQFLVCPQCGSESAVEFPAYPPATLLRPGKPEKGGSAVGLGKESISLLIAVVSVTCTNEKCGRTLIVTLDQSGDGQVLAGRRELLSVVGRGLEPEDSGIGELVWDGKEEIWLKAQSRGEDSVYQGYDEQARKWVVPVKLGERAAGVAR